MSRIIPTTKITFSIPVHVSNINRQFSIYDLVFDAFENNIVNEVLAKNKTLKEYWDSELKGINKEVYDYYISLVTRTIYTRLKDKYLVDTDHNIFSISKTKPVDNTGLSFTLTTTIGVDMRKIKKDVKNHISVDKNIKVKLLDECNVSAIGLEVEENGFMVEFADKYINFRDALMQTNIDINQLRFEYFIRYNPTLAMTDCMQFILQANLSYYDDRYAKTLGNYICAHSNLIVKNVEYGYKTIWIYMNPAGTDEYDKAKSIVEKYLGKEFITTWENYSQSRTRLQELISSKTKSR